MYATAILDETGQNLQDNMLIYRINLSDSYSVSRYQGNINDLLVTGSLKNIVFWKNTPTKALLIVNNCNLSSSIVPNRNNYVTLYTCPLYSQPFTGIVRTNLYNMIASNSWNSNSASLAPNLQKLSNLIIGDTQFFLSYPIQNNILSNSAELFYNNLLANTPACITPDVSQVLTSSALIITARKSNFNFNNVKTTFAGGSLSISPPIITGQVRNDLIVINSSGNLQARLGNPTNGNLGQAVSGDIILGECQTQYQADALTLKNYDNKSVYNQESNISFIAGESISQNDAISIQNVNTNGVLVQKLTANSSSSTDINNTTTTLTNFNLPQNTNSILLVFYGESNPYQGANIIPENFIVNGVSQTANKIADWSYGFSGTSQTGSAFGSIRTIIFKIDLTQAQLNNLTISYALGNFQIRASYQYHIALQNLNTLTATNLSAPINGNPNSAVITEASTNNYYILFNNGLSVSVAGSASAPQDYINIGNLPVGNTNLSWTNPTQQSGSNINIPIQFGYLKLTGLGTISTQVVVKSNSGVTNRQNFIGFSNANAKCEWYCKCYCVRFRNRTN